jgi:hypothetical protein
MSVISRLSWRSEPGLRLTVVLRSKANLKLRRTDQQYSPGDRRRSVWTTE